MGSCHSPLSPSPAAAKSSDFATCPTSRTLGSRHSRPLYHLREARLTKSTSLPLFRGPTGKIDVVTTRSEELCQIRRFYHADQRVFRPKRGTLSHGRYSVGHLGAPRGPCAVVIPSDLPYGGRKSGNAVGFVSKPALAVVITAELALTGFWKRAPRAWRWQQHANWRCDPEPALSASFQAPFRMGPYPDFVRVRKAGQGPQRIKGSSRR